MTARGRPAVLTPALLAEISKRRESGETHEQIASELRIAVGTSRYGGWLSRRPTSLRPPRLQFVSGAETSTETSAKANGGGTA